MFPKILTPKGTTSKISAVFNINSLSFNSFSVLGFPNNVLVPAQINSF